MANARAVGPYASIREAITVQLAAGMTPREAARVVALAIGRVPGDASLRRYAYELANGARGKPVRMQLLLAASDHARLLTAATARGLTPGALVLRLTLAALNETLIDAILDDGEDA